VRRASTKGKLVLQYSSRKLLTNLSSQARTKSDQGAPFDLRDLPRIREREVLPSTHASAQRSEARLGLEEIKPTYIKDERHGGHYTNGWNLHTLVQMHRDEVWN
jgi:hypothetical protein